MRRSRDYGQCPAEILLHLRRLPVFLKQHGLHHTAHTLEMEAGVFFEAAHLLELVSQARWGSAHRYLRCFSALWGDDDDGAATQYTALLDSLAHNSKLAWFACRGDEGGRAASLRKPPLHLYREAYPEIAERETMYCSMASQQARESVDWNGIKLGTLERAKELLRLRPNLERLQSNRLPRHTPIPQDIVPLGFRGCRRHHPRKRVGHKAARDLAYFLVHKRMPPRQKMKLSVFDEVLPINLSYANSGGPKLPATYGLSKIWLDKDKIV